MRKGIKDFTTRKKRKTDKKQICNIVGNIELTYNDYLLKQEDIPLYEKRLLDCREQFKISYKGTRMTNPIDLCIHASLMSEIFNFYNNDICIDMAKILAMVDGEREYHFRVIFNLIDTISVKICSCWEYIFQILNKYFMLELNSMNLSRDRLEKIYEKKMVFVKNEQGYKIEYVEWSEEEREKVRIALGEKKKVLHIGKKAKDFKKAIKQQGYVVSERVNQISILYSEKCVERLKDVVRNTITHKKSSTFAYTIGEIDFAFPQEGISCNRNGWLGITDAKELLWDNVCVLRKAVQVANEIIWLGDRLVRCGNENKKYEIVELECQKCQNHFNLTSELYDIEIRYMKSIKCPKCYEETQFIGKGMVSEFDYGLVRGQDIGYLNDMRKLRDY